MAQEIVGYRTLEPEEVELINTIKAKGQELAELLDRCEKFDNDAVSRGSGVPWNLATSREAARWRAIARTHFQEGTMALTRSVAKPAGF